MTADDLAKVVEHVRRTLPSIPIVVDLQGAKMRLGSFQPIDVAQGQSVSLALVPGENDVPLPHPEIFRCVSIGDTLSCDDDRVHLRIEHIETDRLVVRSLVTATLRPRKGVNVVEHPVELDDLTPPDIAQIEACRAFNHLSFACSFMRDGRESEWIRSRAPRCPIVGKVERAEAVAAIEDLAQCVDIVWICRGDLGAQLGLVPLARWLADFDPRSVSKPTLIAGQVLEHLTHHADPTRSEVCHLFDLLTRGYSGLVLSDETAIGTDPVNATRVASQLVAESQKTQS